MTLAGNFNLPLGLAVSPSATLATARPYTLYRATNPSGNGNLQLLGPDGNPIGINTARGIPLINLNARVTRNLRVGNDRLGVFAEFYNLTNRANFGNQFGGNQFAPATYQKPVAFLGGVGAVSTIPNSFQVQFGARYTF